jgi:hypothetical protein
VGRHKREVRAFAGKNLPELSLKPGYASNMDAQKSNPGGTSLHPLYEPPSLRLLGTVSELTESCFLGKALGDPDYVFHIPVPITNCSR